MARPKKPPKSSVRNRNVGVRKVRAGDLIPHPKNWRKHPAQQAGALKGILAEVGFVGTLIARQVPEGLQLIDGQLRAETLPDELVDVMVVDLNDAEVELVLATHDPMGTMAEPDATQLDALLADLEISSGEVAEMLSDYMDTLGAVDPEPIKRSQAGGSDAEYPLVPVFNEKYEYVVIFCVNDTEWGALQTLLQLQRQKSYKSTGIGIGRVVPAPRFFELWEKRHGTNDRLPKSQPGKHVPDAPGDPD